MTLDEIKQEAERLFPAGDYRITRFDVVDFAQHCMNKATGWRPIEEAPKDESVIHLCLPISKREVCKDDRRVYEGRWCAAQKAFTSVNGFILLNNATHYRPLPPAPEAA